MSTPRPILIVEDDAALRATLAEQLAAEGGFTAEEATTATEAEAKLAGDGARYDAILLDDDRDGLVCIEVQEFQALHRSFLGEVHRYGADEEDPEDRRACCHAICI